MAEGTANFVTRGKGQQIDLSPYLYSYDPDFPDDKVYFIKLGLLNKNWVSFIFISIFTISISSLNGFFQIVLGYGISLVLPENGKL